MENEKKPMSKNTKIILGIILGLIVLCIFSCVGGWLALRITGKTLMNNMTFDEPEEARIFAHKIIDYDLPAGYQEAGGFNMGIMKMVGISDDDSNRPIIMLMEIPAVVEMDEEEMMLELQLMVKKQENEGNYDMELVEEKIINIRGQEVPLLIYEGTDENGSPVKEIISGIFEGKNGTVMLLILGEEAAWDQAEIDAFINSIR